MLIIILLALCSSIAIPSTFNISDNMAQTILLTSNHDFTIDEVSILDTLGNLSTVAGPVAVLHTNNLQEIENLPFQVRIEHPHPLRALLDASVTELGAPSVWQELRDYNGLNVTGTGVIIGFVDTGIDLKHPDFNFPNGSTKILYVWDQTLSGHSPDGFGYGFECSSLDIQANTCPEVDTFGHGTHIAGIAASSGIATGNYMGVAPEASIIFVRSGYPICSGSSWTFDDAHILDGINYIVKKAHELGRRAVINLSLGGNIGGHDGTDPLEQALDAFVAEGTPIVVAAGNEAEDNLHAHGQLTSQSSITVNVGVKPETDDLQIDLWFSRQDKINATLTTPDGQNYSTHAISAGILTKFGKATGAIRSTSLGQETYMEISSLTALPTSGWKFSLEPMENPTNGTWDAWVDADSCSFPPAYFLHGNGYSIDPNDTIGIPGTAHNVVTVGAYVTKTSWFGSNGNSYGSSETAAGQIAPFSSLGPTRDGRTKPDIVAPGMFITSARSEQIPSSTSDPDRYHRVLAGTSMSAPQVAGIIALMLQYDPTISALQIPAILRESAREDPFTGLLPAGGSWTWGYGKADARSATGFFRLSIDSLSLPSSATFRVSVDHDQRSLHGHSWLDLYFPNGTAHRIVIRNEMVAEANVRYLMLGITNFTVSTNQIDVLKYTVQYYLEVTSNYGATEGSGWYDVGAVIRLNVPPATNPGGILGVFRARFLNIGAWTEGSKTIQHESIILDRPKSVTILYLLCYPLEMTESIIAICLSILLVCGLHKHFTSSSHKQSSPAPEHHIQQDHSQER